MDVNQFLHAMPEVAQDEIIKAGVNAISIGDGVNRLAIAGHDHGVAYFFKADQIYNPEKSAESGYEVFETMEQCYRITDRDNVSPMPILLRKTSGEVHYYPVPKDLLAFNRDGECVGGKYKESYSNWKQGKSQPGFSLRKWDVLSDSMIATLEAEGIFTIEQFAAYPRDRFAARFPQDFIDAHTRAEQWVSGKEVRENSAKNLARMQELEAKLAAQEKEKADLAERLAKLEALSAGEARNGKKKVKNKLLEN